MVRMRAIFLLSLCFFLAGYTASCLPCIPTLSKTKQIQALSRRGVTVVVLGDQILIVVPSDRLFQPMTANITSQGSLLLCAVAQYINSYTKMLVKVAAYTGETGSQRVALALSQQQADNVATLLRQDGINARVLYAVGYGRDHLVERNCNHWGNDNFRIEITLEKLEGC